MKIVFVSCITPRTGTYPRTGGVGRYAKNVALHMPLKPADEIVFLGNVYGAPETYWLTPQIEVRHCWAIGWLFPFQLIRQLRELTPDVVHVQHEMRMYGGGFSSYLLCIVLAYLRWRRIPVVTTIHGVVPQKAIDEEFVRANQSPLPVWMIRVAFRTIYKCLAHFTSVVAVHENSFRRSMIEDYGTDQSRIALIRHYVEQDISMTPRPDARRKLNISEDRRVCLFFGFVSGYKGVDILIEGFSRFAKCDPKAYLLIAGGMNPSLTENTKYLAFYRSLQARAAEVIPADQYRWAGLIPEADVPDYFGACDVSVFPYSIYMGSSGPLSFSLAYGKEFVASSAFGEDIRIPEFIFDATPQGFADKLEQYFAGRLGSSRQRMEVLANERSMTTVTRQAYELYFSLCRLSERRAALAAR